nr:hypothetical protein [Romboutsia hominis]
MLDKLLILSVRFNSFPSIRISKYIDKVIGNPILDIKVCISNSIISPIL